MANPAARDPGPLVTFVLKRTVAKVLSIGFVVRRWIQCSAGVVVELQQDIEVVDDLGDHFRVLRAEGNREGLDRDLSFVDVFGVVDVLDGRQRGRMR
ncbi:hypothetical protein MTY66_35710 [Mycolicibacterium sp. TY66]|uniref:hypothetical protein n=1 Tax=Mycolicibacterium sp. TY66 TaxID=2755560 RepID=UPI001BB6F4E9|nr:hypothetical protein MTY66_35710 [Mycolicibacterium sp. TY66]